MLLADSTDAVSIDRAGFSLSDFRLHKDSTSWDPLSIVSTDSSIVLSGLTVVDDSSRTMYPDTLAFSIAGTSPFQKIINVDSGRFLYISSYPFIDAPLFPAAGDRPMRLSFTTPFDSTSTIGAPGAVEVQNGDSSRMVVHIEPSAHVTTVGNYLVTGPFEVIEDRVILGDGTDVGVRYLFAGMESRSLLRAFGSAPEALRFFDANLGLIPTDRAISIVSLPGIPDAKLLALSGLFGAPDESVLLTTETSRVASTASSVAFNYFGRYGFVTPADSWLFTGLPLYLGAMFVEADQGAAAFDSLMLSYEDKYFNSTSEDTRPLFTPQWDDAIDLIDSTALFRGAWTVHTIRHLAGEANFRQALVELQQGLILQSDNLTQILEAYLPEELQPFQRELFYGDSPLQLQLEWSYSAVTGNVDIILSHANTNTSAEWPPVPVTIEIETLTGVQRHYMLLEDSSTSASITVSGRPRYVTVDPDQVLLARIDIDQPVAAWVAQLRSAENLSVRVKAARALKQFSSDPALLIGLKSALREEQRVPVKVAILETVAIIPPGTAPRQTLLESLGDPAPEVRTAALRGLSGYSDDPVVHSRVTGLLGNESDEHVLAAAVTFLANSTYEGRAQVIESALITSTRNHLVRIAGIEGMKLNGSSRDQLAVGRRYSSASHPAAVRTAALGLQAHSLEGTRRSDLARTYLDDGQPELRIAAAEILAGMEDDTAAILREALATEANPLVRNQLRRMLKSAER